MLLEHPRIGEQLFRFYPREVRRLLVDAYEIRYEIQNDDIYILRIWHSREARHNIVLTNFYILLQCLHSRTCSRCITDAMPTSCVQPSRRWHLFNPLPRQLLQPAGETSPVRVSFSCFLSQFTGESYEHSDFKQNASFLAPV